MSKNHRFETLQLHAGQTLDPITHAQALPIFQTSHFGLQSASQGAKLFALQEFGNTHTRTMNPTTDVFEKRMATLEGGVAGLATSSGQAARFITFTNILQTGDQFISSPYVTADTRSQFTSQFRSLGIDAQFATKATPESFAKRITEQTKAFYIETVGSTTHNVPDFEGFKQLAQETGVPLIVDNTAGAAGYLCKPIEHGANIVIASATAWIGGHGTSLGGVIIDAGNFDWGNGKFPLFTEPSIKYPRMNFWESFGESSPYGNLAFILRARLEGLQDIGATLSPFNAFLLVQGLETLSLRVQRHVDNTLELARWLEGHSQVSSVDYPGLSNSPYYEMASKYLKNGFGGILSFCVSGGNEHAGHFIDRLELATHQTGVGSTKTSVLHPGSTIHRQRTEEERSSSGIGPGHVQVSVGIEHIDDIKEDFEQALQEAAE